MSTIAALSSGRPPAAVAIIRTSGPDAVAAAERIAGPLPPARHAALRELRHPIDGAWLDTALVLVFPSPHSATGEDIVEYQCHGGRAVVDAILGALTSIEGIRLAQPGEFTRRALAHGRIDLPEAEGLADLLEAETEQQRKTALVLAGGALSRQVEQWQARVVDLSARAEAAIDYVGDKDETQIDATDLCEGMTSLAEELDEWLARPRLEPLKEGIRVAVAGPPNAGKSSLINALAGQDRSIVTPIEGTTRDTIEVPLAIDGLPIILVDTAGLRPSSDPVEAIGIERACHEIAQSDILLWLGDAGAMPLHSCRILIRSKSDLAGDEHRISDISVSAHTGMNVTKLLTMIGGIASEMLPTGDSVALNRRQHDSIAEARSFLHDPPEDIILIAEHLRSARAIFDRLTGRASIEETLDALFSRFCLGK